MKLIIIFYFLCSGFAHAELKDPETIVRLSVFDLLNAQQKSKPRISKNYGKEVAALLIQNEKGILGCFPKIKEKIQLFFNFKIKPSGKAIDENIQFESSKLQEAEEVCLSKILRNISFPKHKLTHPVDIEFPLSLEAVEQ